MSAREPFDTLAPAFAVRVNGQDLPAQAQADLVGVSVLDDVEAAGMFTFTLDAWDTTTMQPKWMDDSLCREGNPVEVQIGYVDRRESLISGEITGIEPEFAQGRPPRVTIRGHDARHRLMRSRRSRTYLESKDSDIASRLAGESGLEPQVDDSGVKLPFVFQHNQTDFEFLKGRAQRIGFELVVRDRKLIFRNRPAGLDPVATLRRDVELLDFRARLSTLGQVPEVQVRGWDPSSKQEIVGRAGASEVRGMADATGPSAVQQAFGTAASGRVQAPVHSQAEADQLAARSMAELALNYVRAQGTCIGDPRLCAGTVIAVEDVGQRFSGRYYLTSVEHRFDRRNGYRTHFIARRNAA